MLEAPSVHSPRVTPLLCLCPIQSQQVVSQPRKGEPRSRCGVFGQDLERHRGAARA